MAVGDQESTEAAVVIKSIPEEISAGKKVDAENKFEFSNGIRVVDEKFRRSKKRKEAYCCGDGDDQRSRPNKIRRIMAPSHVGEVVECSFGIVNRYDHGPLLPLASSSSSSSATTTAAAHENNIKSIICSTPASNARVDKKRSKKKTGKKETVPEPSSEFHYSMCQIAETHGCTSAPVHFYSKEVTLSDVLATQNRLLITDKAKKVREMLKQVLNNEEMNIVDRSSDGLAVVLVDGAGKVYENIVKGYDREGRKLYSKCARLKYLDSNGTFRIRGSNYKMFIGDYKPEVEQDLLYLWAFLAVRDNGEREIWIGIMKEKNRLAAQTGNKCQKKSAASLDHEQIIATEKNVIALPLLAPVVHDAVREVEIAAETLILMSKNKRPSPVAAENSHGRSRAEVPVPATVSGSLLQYLTSLPLRWRGRRRGTTLKHS